jgi:hypothetical protein
MAFNVGDQVKVLPPFDIALPDVYVIEGADESGALLIAGGRSFAAEFLQLVQAGDGAPAEPAAWVITRYAFRQRFTADEKVAIEIASLDNPAAPIEQRSAAARLRVYLRDLDNAQHVNLKDAATRGPVQALEPAGLIAAGRATAILDTPPSPNELLV